MPDPDLLGRRTWDAADLMRRYPPRWSHPNKTIVAEISCPPGRPHSGEITVTRWREAGLPDAAFDALPAMTARRGFYAYGKPAAGDATTHWHVNFADPQLFGFAEGQLLAQDELQVAEHPVLLAVRHALVTDGDPAVKPRTVEGGKATPVLVCNAERRCAITGLYGNAFAHADATAVRAATKPIEGVRSNILAIAAPGGGRGAYTETDITGVLRAAYAGYRAAVLESPAGATLHTGFWGCGAFGGNRVLMSALQLVAAKLAGMAAVEFWWGSSAGDEQALREGQELASELAGRQLAIPALVSELAAKRFYWGVSDGN